MPAGATSIRGREKFGPTAGFLVVVEGRLDERPAGPTIRGLGVARALSAHASVTLVAHPPVPAIFDGLRAVELRRRTVVRELGRHGAIWAPWVQPYALLAARRSGAVCVADLYDPADLELPTAGRSAQTAAVERLTELQLRHADVLVFASAAQRERHGIDAEDACTLEIPMGIPQVPAPRASDVLRSAFPQIAGDDPVVLWWGTAWRWLDGATAIDAVARLVAERPRLRFVVSAGPPTTSGTASLDGTADMRAAAERAGLLDRNVFFLDRWIPFGQHYDVLREADVGLTLSCPGEEARLAARARYGDYLAAGLPCVLTDGDEMGALMASHGLARLVPAGDAGAAAAAIGATVDQGRPGDGVAVLQQELAWPRLMEGVQAAVTAARARGRRTTTTAVAQDVARYYALRAAQRARRACPPFSG